jgi:hypothetical protein
MEEHKARPEMIIDRRSFKMGVRGSKEEDKVYGLTSYLRIESRGRGRKEGKLRKPLGGVSGATVESNGTRERNANGFQTHHSS